MKIKKLELVLLYIVVLLFFSAYTVKAEDENSYERYFQFREFTSENGLDGTAVNCILPSRDGFLWLGSYSGLQQYDGTEFKNCLINGKALPINDIEQDEDGKFWIGTNGEGVYHYNGKEFKKVDFEGTGEGALTINQLARDSSGKIWIGTREGLFVYDQEMQSIEGLEKTDILALTELEDGQILVIEKTGKLYLVKDFEVSEFTIQELEGTGKPRCCTAAEHGYFYIGTSKEQILKCNIESCEIEIYENPELKCINSITKLDQEAYWICTDTGIGLLRNGTVKKLQIPLTDSVEEVCADYEGNYWFVSSRQGMVQVFHNLFSDLGTYLGITETVNSVVFHRENLYVGCDDGLYCFYNRDCIQNPLTDLCKGERVRQIYKDRNENLWVSTYYSGLILMDATGKISIFNTESSGLQTNQIRCTWQRENGELLVGTEQGVYVIDTEKQVKQLIIHPDFNTMRILDVREATGGEIYVATDGHGVYVIEDNKIKTIYTKHQGILSNNVMKVVPSKQLDGVWFVSGFGMDFVSENGTITEMTDFVKENILAIDLLENGEALIYTAKGLMRIQEKDLLRGCYDSVKYYGRHDGLPIDFTANAWNSIQDDVVYMCGTKGFACIDLKRKMSHQALKLYIHKISMDGKEITAKENIFQLPSDGYRLTLDVRCINYIYQDYYVSYYLEGVDQKPTILENSSKSEISYTNLKGGDYTYHFMIINPENKECLGKLTIPISKNKSLFERSEVQILMLIFIGLLISMIVALLVRFREKRIHKRVELEYQKEKEKMIEKLAYRDLVTGVYNRNLFEEDKKEVEIEEITAIVIFSVNHMSYIEQKKGVIQAGKILRYAVETVRKYQNPKIYRLSENIFCLLFFECIDLDFYVMTIKSDFSKKGEEENIKLSLAVGAIYNDYLKNETMDTLLSRCEKIRLLDEKKAEAEFIKGKMNLLS